MSWVGSGANDAGAGLAIPVVGRRPRLGDPARSEGGSAPPHLGNPTAAYGGPGPGEVGREPPRSRAFPGTALRGAWRWRRGVATFGKKGHRKQSPW